MHRAHVPDGFWSVVVLVLAAVLVSLALIGLAATPAHGTPCTAPDNGSGTIDFPPITGATCPGGYAWPEGAPLVIDGLPPGATLASGPGTHLEIATRNDNCDPDWWVESFFDISYHVEFTGAPGGPLDGFSGITTRTTSIRLGAPCRAPDSGLGTVVFPPQTVPGCNAGFLWPEGETLILDGLPPGTSIVSGPNTRLEIGWHDEIPGGTLGGTVGGFDGTLYLDLVGTGDLAGYARTIPMFVTGQIHSGPRAVGTPAQVFVNVFFGLEGTVTGDPDFATLTVCGCEALGLLSPGHSLILGGCVSSFTGTLHLDMVGTGVLTGYNRYLQVPVTGEIRGNPRFPGDPVQAFDQDFVRLEGEIFGDPDFSTLRIDAGIEHGLPAPGMTVLTELPSGDFAVDSFFDVTFRVAMEGAPGSPLDGFAGTTITPPHIVLGESGTTGTLDPSHPAGLVLHAASPNPVTAGTRLMFDLPRDGHARLDVVDVTGRCVATLLDRSLPAGSHVAGWNARLDDGRPAAAGIYVLVLTSGGERRATRVAVLR